VEAARSDPAKSTKVNLAQLFSFFIKTYRIAWDLVDSSFAPVGSLALFLLPIFNKVIISLGEFTSTSETPAMT